MGDSTKVTESYDFVSRIPWQSEVPLMGTTYVWGAHSKQFETELAERETSEKALARLQNMAIAYCKMTRGCVEVQAQKKELVIDPIYETVVGENRLHVSIYKAPAETVFEKVALGTTRFVNSISLLLHTMWGDQPLHDHNPTPAGKKVNYSGWRRDL